MFNFWQFINQKIAGMTAGAANYRAQSDEVKAVAPALESALIGEAVNAVAVKAEGVLPLGGLTGDVLSSLLTPSLLTPSTPTQEN
ncbi:MAG: hypothetical protein ACRYFS_10365 [Janthinobacterium lividum]